MASLNLPEKVYLNLSADLSGFGKEISDISCYKNKELQKILYSEVPVIMTSEQPYSDAQNITNKVAPKSSVVIANNGAYAMGSDGKVYMDKKIPRTAIDAIEKVLKDKGFFKYGLPVIQTLNEKISSIDPSFSFWKRFKIHLGFGKKLKLENNLYEKSKDNAYNFNFETFPVPSKSSKPYAMSKRNPKGLPWNQMYQITLKQQGKVFYGAMQALLDADEETRKLYEPYVSMTISQNGFSIMPKGCSKVDTLAKYCAENKIDKSSIMLYGNNFSDFFESGSLSALRKDIDEDKFIGEEASASKSFMKLSKLPDGMTPKNNMQTYYIGTIKKFSQKQLEVKLKSIENDVVAKDLEVFRDDLLTEKTKVERVNKYGRKMQELMRKVPPTLGNGELNPEFEKGKKAIQLEINNIMEDATKEINNIPLNKKDIFEIKTVDVMRTDLQTKMEELSDLQAKKKDDENVEVEKKENTPDKKPQEITPIKLTKAVSPRANFTP